VTHQVDFLPAFDSVLVIYFILKHRSSEKNIDLIDINASAFFHSLMFTDMFFNGAFNGSSC
jgi:hypothetical protein